MGNRPGQARFMTREMMTDAVAAQVEEGSIAAGAKRLGISRQAFRLPDAAMVTVFLGDLRKLAERDD